jgi:hypothetical protein
MHGLTGGDWKRGRYQRKPRQSPTLPRSLYCMVLGYLPLVVAGPGAVLVAASPV